MEGEPGDRVLIVGGAGFVGAGLVRALTARGERPRVLDWGRAAGGAYLDGTGAELVAGDFTDRKTVRDALEGIDRVVHLAARTSVPASIAAPWEDFEQNVLGTIALLEESRRAGVGRFVFASSNAAVGLVEAPAHELIAPRPVAPYGAAKLAVEGYLHAYHRSYGMCTTALRFSNAYGPYSLHKASVVAAMIRAALAAHPVVVYGDGSQTRDFVHVDDLVRIVLAVLDAPADAVAGELFQAGSGTETTVHALAERIVAAVAASGLPVAPIEHRPARHGDVLRSSSDVSKVGRVLGYRPAVDLEDGLTATVRWFREALADSALTPIAAVSATSGSD